ncbi:Phage abortive infection protein [Zobellia roscoffensis]|uniref:hypothetical protein n=1 Tax=Zobellia roscoffensis TaxID=2779508 RepID=UPI00188D160C|nr:hypothetical protein [Zobellia roscoffensis]
MIEWINNTFGIKNDVSIPILISLIVFIVGGIASYLLHKIRQYSSRTRTRKVFYSLLEEVITNLKVKEKHTSKFYSEIKTDHEGGWYLPYTTISFLETFFELDFNDIYFSFRKKFYWKFCSRKIRYKAFNRIWSVLRNLRFFEQKLERDLEKMVSRFDLFHKEYGVKLEEYRKYHDDLSRKTEGMQIPKSEKKLFDYLMAQDKIWLDWQQLDEKKRTSFFITYNQLVKPVLELNRKNSDLPITQEADDLLLACTHQYIEMENTLNIYQEIFKQYYLTYRQARVILKKCLEIIK